MSEDINRILEISTPSGSAPAENAATTPENIGGWLVFPAIGLMLGGILSVIFLIVSIGLASDLSSRYQGIFAFDVGLTAFLIYAAVRFFGKRRNAPATMIALIVTGLIVNGLLLAIDIGADAEPFAIESGKALAKGIVGAFIWIPYFLVSKRVKKTFVVP